MQSTPRQVANALLVVVLGVFPVWGGEGGEQPKSKPRDLPPSAPSIQPQQPPQAAPVTLPDPFDKAGDRAVLASLSSKARAEVVKRLKYIIAMPDNTLCDVSEWCEVHEMWSRCIRSETPVIEHRGEGIFITKEKGKPRWLVAKTDEAKAWRLYFNHQPDSEFSGEPTGCRCNSNGESVAQTPVVVDAASKSSSLLFVDEGNRHQVLQQEKHPHYTRVLERPEPGLVRVSFSKYLAPQKWTDKYTVKVPPRILDENHLPGTFAIWRKDASSPFEYIPVRLGAVSASAYVQAIRDNRLPLAVYRWDKVKSGQGDSFYWVKETVDVSPVSKAGKP